MEKLDGVNVGMLASTFWILGCLQGMGCVTSGSFGKRGQAIYARFD